MPLRTKHGDTLIEVLFAIAIFSFLVIATITLMNNTVASSQGNLESTMARSFLNEQAEVIRFAHDAKINQIAGSNSKYADLWDKITTQHVVNEDKIVKNLSDVKSCSEIILPNEAFVINTRTVYTDENPAANSIISKIDNKDTLYPRILYSNGSDEEDDAAVFLDSGDAIRVKQVEGFWVYAINGGGYYDFYFQACWNAPGRSIPTTLDTVIRLYTR